MKKTNPVKEELKQLAQEIKQSKIDLKDAQRNGNVGYKMHWKVSHLKDEFRYKHITYCLLRGREYEEIERPKEGNEPDFFKIEDLKKQFTKRLEEYYAPKEDVCSSSTGS